MLVKQVKKGRLTIRGSGSRCNNERGKVQKCDR